MKRMLMVVLSALLLFTAVPASAHIPHQEVEPSEQHVCWSPSSQGWHTLNNFRIVMKVRTNVTGWHDVGWGGNIDWRFKQSTTRTYLSAYQYKTVRTPWMSAGISVSNGMGVPALGQSWIKFISSLEHGNVYVDTIGIECDWSWGTA